jgi:beta-1,4-mannosyltransferase
MKIFVYPYSDNPYQELLYKDILQNNQVYFCRTNPLIIFFFPIVAGYFRLKGYNIFHLHWISFSTKKTIFSKQLSFFNTLLCLYVIKIYKYKLIWTVHNILPHEKQTMHDLFLAQQLSKLADAKIVHSNHTLRQMSDLGLKTSSTFVVPHGNYNGVYPNNINRKDARIQLKINEGEFVILFFGIIRPYKGIDNLIDSFTKLKLDNAKLLIVGNCTDETIRQKILAAQEKLNITFYDEYIENEEVAKYFNAADILCLPFKSVTTSGSALLALSFGKPIIAPLEGSLLDVPRDVGYLYNINEPFALKESIREAYNNISKLTTMQTNALEYSKTLDWQSIAEKTYTIYENLIH